MGLRPDRPRTAPWLFVLAAVAVSAVCWWFGTHLQPVWWAAWLAPLPILMLSVRTRAGNAALAAFAAVGIGLCNQWLYMHDVIGLPLAVCLLAIATPALAFVVVTLLFRTLALRGRTLAAALSVPLLWTTLGYLGAVISPHGTFGHIAYTQMDALPVIQIASITGLWGVGFLVWLFSGLVATLTVSGVSARQRWTTATIGACVFALGIGFGVWRLHEGNRAPAQVVRVGLLSIGEDSSAALSKPEGQRMLGRYAGEIDRLAAAGAQIVVAPESTLLVDSHSIPTLKALSARRGIRILIGAEDHSDPRAKHNAALVFEPGGPAPASYFKQHLIPGFEDRYTPGDSHTMLARIPRTGVAICKDLDFTATGRAYGQREAQLLLVPAWDFGIDAWMHARMAVLRGVEGGFAVARSARNGLLTLSDDRGRVLSQASSAGTGDVVSLRGKLPLRQTRTLYSRHGDVFAWLCLLATIGIVASLLPKRKRPA